MMFEYLPITNYEVRQIKYWSRIAGIVMVCILILGNGIAAIVRDRVRVDKSSYTMKQGFPVFTSAKDYLNLIRHYPYNPGVSLRIHTVRPGESLWDLALQRGLSIDTLIAANPFLTNLAVSENTEIVIPSEDGVLFAFISFFDVGKMSNKLSFRGKIRGDYLPAPFAIISTDDIRLVFFKNARPVVVNDSLEKLYRLKNIFQQPLRGCYTSLFGDRVHPFFEGMAFHSGVDIMGAYGLPVKPAREGMVIYTGWKDGFGKTVMVQHQDGYTTLYGHFQAVKVRVGDWVTRDDVIGLCGSTGWSTGPHVHFTVMKHGKYLNPLLFIW